MSFAGNADLPADEQVDDRVEMDWAGFDLGRGGQQKRERDAVLVPEVHQRTKRQAAGDGKQHRGQQ